MYRQKVADLLALNGIDESTFLHKLHNTLLHGVFEAVCKDIRKQNTKTLEKERFRKYRDKAIPTRKIVERYAGCTLNDDDYIELSKLFTAFFRAGDPRIRFAPSYRQHLVEEQKGRCAVCNAQISVRDSHLDHIIPWDYVGDQLDGNYQMLCETCNERKGSATYFELSMLLLKQAAR